LLSDFFILCTAQVSSTAFPWSLVIKGGLLGNTGPFSGLTVASMSTTAMRKFIASGESNGTNFARFYMSSTSRPDTFAFNGIWGGDQYTAGFVPTANQLPFKEIAIGSLSDTYSISAGSTFTLMGVRS